MKTENISQFRSSQSNEIVMNKVEKHYSIYDILRENSRLQKEAMEANRQQYINLIYGSNQILSTTDNEIEKQTEIENDSESQSQTNKKIYKPTENLQENDDFSIKLFNENESSTESNQFSLDACDKMDGWEFENYCAGLLRLNGFKKVIVTRGSGDHGIDITATMWGAKFDLQCKRYNGAVSNKAVQEVYTGYTYYDLQVPVIITNSYFTQQAIEEATKTGVQLWDGNKLEELIQKANSLHKTKCF